MRRHGCFAQEDILQYLYLMILVFGLLVSSAEAEPLTLNTAMQLATSRNAGLAAQQQRAQALAEHAAWAGDLPNPVLNMGALNVPVDSWSRSQEAMTQMQLGLSQQVPFPGKRRLLTRSAEAEAGAASLEAVEWRQQLLLAVQHRWWNLFYLDHALAAEARNRQLLQQLVDVAESKYRVGKGLQQDVLLAQLELSRLLDSEYQLQAARQQAQAALNALLNRSADAPIEIADAAVEELPEVPDLQPLLDEAAGKRARILAMQQHLDAAESRTAYAEHNDYPDFKISASYGLRRGINPATGGKRADLASVQLSMDLPWFNGDRQDKQLAQRQAEQAGQILQTQDVQAQVAAEIVQAVSLFRQARAQVVLYQSGILPQAEQTVASMRAGYAVNKVDFLNLVRAQVGLYNDETRYWRALADARQALADIRAATGKAMMQEEGDE